MRGHIVQRPMVNDTPYRGPNRREPRDSVVYRAKLSQEQEEAAATCVTCGCKALYRVYTETGKNIGACAAHREDAKARSAYFR